MDEKFILQGLNAKNKIVFDFVFHYYYSGLCAYVERIVNDENISEDIVQDFFITLWIKHDQLQISTSLKNYLFTSVRNRSLDYLRSQKNKKLYLSSAVDTKNYTENLSTFWFAESELETLFEKSLEKLPPRCREIFVLSRIDGVKNQQIAEKFGISKRTVELQISNALKLLRKDLSPYLPLSLLYFFLK
ncbi:RNA polymerase sigma-70 factor [Mariniphaga sediminis]|uniref:RNA polymerase sigma-70 factor n=1 Tax=Mariniphaga sediminis TaxID=1628158 RepID=UPI0035697BBA